MKLSFRFPLIYLFALIILLGGFLNYLLFQPDIILFKNTGIHMTSYYIENNFLRCLFTGYFSDIAWCFSLCFITFAMADLNFIKPSGKIFLLILPFITEGMQYIRLINGTFDWYDVLIYFTIITFFVLFFSSFKTFVYEKK